MSQQQISILTDIESGALSEGFRANLTAQQESDLVKKMIDTSGRTSLEQFNRFNQHGLWAKTFSALLIGQMDWFSMRCKLTWKLKGTKYNRMFFQLAVSEHPTNDIEHSLLLTPTSMQRMEDPASMRARAKEKGYKNGTKYNSLTSQVVYHPGMKKFLPTPRASDAKGGATKESYQARGRTETNDLKTWGAFQNNSGKTSQLNPQFVAEMMGFPVNWTVLPFLNGETKA